MKKGVLFLIFATLSSAISVSAENYKQNAESLLARWCDGMIEWQVEESSDSEIDGSLYCQTCDKIHGRCMDAVYPFMYMYNKTGEAKYLNAAIDVMEWSKNVTAPDGSWTVIPNPKSWKGITVFGAISLAETLKHYGNLLPAEVKQQWDHRLRSAADYIYDTFTLTFTNINYGISAIYAMHLIGEYLDEPRYIEKSTELCEGVEECFTNNNTLLYGEGKPYDTLSEKGLQAVDLGYNVEETLNALALYAVNTNNEEIKRIAIKSLKSHLEFMLPDGGWDNSWGTRQYKWSYWGSRTTEGSLPGYGVLSDKDATFAEAVVRSTELLERCTDPKYNLISGGIHYHTHGVMPCIHHTFTHAKALASLLDCKIDFDLFDLRTALPRDAANGVKHFQDIDTWLVSTQDWRATITSYDLLYTHGSQQATGGAISVLYNTKVGLILTASLADYNLVEVNNQQPNPAEDFAITPRVEVVIDGQKYNNLYDHSAAVKYSETKKGIYFEVENSLKNSSYDSPSNTVTTEVKYTFNNKGELQYQISKVSGLKDNDVESAELILPIVCSSEESATQDSPNQITIQKKGGVVRVSANCPISIKGDLKTRIFNMVPGAEVLPIYIDLKNSPKARVTIEVE